ncbi:DUF1015 domain-containing protein [Desulfofustis limnaeus]|uniref:DUF1015 domain-containing protein n=1 Tax=Desulfofustis limnaeus TaxID=2740163 RepID=A0ABN6M4V4_9BACT|nr:DUF1015 domain-containing protein [Desulfofustis limnaeus]BDD87235.1 hypothetical protein DPPLL_16000 [Desulfofustis limnaeus]
MAVIKPFRGVRYDEAVAGNLEELITPPYDVIDASAQSMFSSRNRYNIVHLDLPKDPGFHGQDDPQRHRRAADLLSAWQHDGILCRDERPALYPYEVEYRLPSGRKRTRKGFICLVKLADFSEKIIRPHEETFTSVIQDRLALTRACRAQFSQVFSVFSDPQGKVISLLEQNRPAAPAVEVTDGDGNRHRLWRLDDPAAIIEVQQAVAAHPLYIADGHHRYTTALAYRKETKGTDGPEGYVMMYLCPKEDAGLTILPTHRLISYPGHFDAQAFVASLEPWFTVTRIGFGSRESLLQELLLAMDEAAPQQGRAIPVLGLYLADSDCGYILHGTDRLLAARSGRPEGLRRLDVAVLNDLIITELLDLDPQRLEHENLVGYHSDVAQALDKSVKMSVAEEPITPLLFLLKGATIDHVCAVSDAGLYMPHKSTYFYPKLMSGLVLNVFDNEHEPGTACRS